MKKQKKIISITLSLVMLFTILQINYEPKAQVDIYRDAIPLEIGQEYTVDPDVNYSLYDSILYDGEGMTGLKMNTDTIYSVLVPPYSTVTAEVPEWVEDVTVSWMYKRVEGEYTLWYDLHDYTNFSGVEETVYLFIDSLTTEFTSRICVDYAFEPEDSYEPDPSLIADFEGQICVYGFDAELGERLEVFYDKYPEYANYIKYINLDNDSATYYIEDVVNLSNCNSTTSIVAAPGETLRGFIESGNYEPLSSIGFDVNSYMNTSYDYAVANCLYNNELYASTWKICPSNFIYDVDIANQVLGTSDPAQVQAMIDTPEKFLQVAELMKAAGYNMCNNFETLPSVTTEVNVGKPSETIDPKMQEFYDVLKSNKYMIGHSQWMNEWYETTQDKRFFGYFSCTWFTSEKFQFVDSKNVKTCRGPVDYAWDYWDGTYLLVDNKNKGNDIVKLVLETLCCDTEIMKDIMFDTNDVVNNKNAVQQFIAEGNGSWANFGGQNPYVVWDEAAKNIYDMKNCEAQGIYVSKMDRTGVTAGIVVEGNKANSEFSWWACEGNSENWFLIQDWVKGNEWLNWTPDKYGDYVIVGKTRICGQPDTESSSHINISYHPQIKGKCQMPYTGEGGGYLIGVESYENPNQSYMYEMLVLDCTLLAEGKDAWIYTTGKFTVPEGNAAWTVWQPQYGYYWTLFRVYDAQGNLLDEQCYGFVNAY